VRDRDHLEDDIKMHLQKVERGHGLDRAGTEKGQVEAFVNALMNLRVA